MVSQEKKTVRQKMFDVLADGYLHSARELFSCLTDDLSQPSAIEWHISNLRKDLAPEGKGIASKREDGVTYYQIVRFIRRA